ncbi:MAG: hypothetical protein KJP16_04875 [Gammaproteobacteria bacterium]|nr:hypothetical protein [Gammaproteobacteria bacterium]NNL50129.1 hypothetical protein [Woeseiaceae bacterium]
MSDAINNKPPMSYWVIAAILLAWNLIGMMFYYMQVTMTPEVMAENFNEAQQAWMINEPIWATAAYGTAVTAGVVAAGLMLMRKALAVTFFILSFVAVLVQDFNAFILSDWQGVWGNSALYLPTVVIVICVFEIWYTRSAKAKGWLV